MPNVSCALEFLFSFGDLVVEVEVIPTGLHW